MENQQKYLVAIQCITYNHEKYLADALEGFVMQKTNFPFVAIVHDDASTDGTAAILRQYAEKYPDIIHPIYETENQYSKRDGSLGRIMNAAVDATGAKYVAMCEGDDYWTDPYKLQKQVDFMEANPMCAIYSHNSYTLDTASRQIGVFNKRMVNKHEYYLPEFLSRNWFTPTQSLLYRRSLYQSVCPVFNSLHGDYSLQINLLLGEKSYLYYDNQVMSVYRNGGWASTHLTVMNLNKDFIALLEYYKTHSNHRCDDVFDTLIQRERRELELYMEYQRNVQRSKSFYVRTIHWICRRLAAFGNMYQNCLTIKKNVIPHSIPPIAELY